jgi:hypothetical protein
MYAYGRKKRGGEVPTNFFTVSSKVRRMVRLRGNGWSLGAVPPAPTYSLMLVETKAKKFSRRDEGQSGVECWRQKSPEWRERERADYVVILSVEVLAEIYYKYIKETSGPPFSGLKNSLYADYPT